MESSRELGGVDWDNVPEPLGHIGVCLVATLLIHTVYEAL